MSACYAHPTFWIFYISKVNPRTTEISQIWKSCIGLKSLLHKYTRSDTSWLNLDFVTSLSDNFSITLRGVTLILSRKTECSPFSKQSLKLLIFYKHQDWKLLSGCISAWLNIWQDENNLKILHQGVLSKKKIKQTHFCLDKFRFWAINSDSVCLWETRNLLFLQVTFFKFCILVSSKSTYSCCRVLFAYRRV